MSFATMLALLAALGTALYLTSPTHTPTSRRTGIPMRMRRSFLTATAMLVLLLISCAITATGSGTITGPIAIEHAGDTGPVLRSLTYSLAAGARPLLLAITLGILVGIIAHSGATATRRMRHHRAAALQ